MTDTDATPGQTPSKIPQNLAEQPTFLHALETALYDLPRESPLLNFFEALAITKGEIGVKDRDSVSKPKVARHAAAFFEHAGKFLEALPEDERKELQATGTLSAEQLIKFQEALTREERVAIQNIFTPSPDRRSALTILGTAFLAGAGSVVAVNGGRRYKKLEDDFNSGEHKFTIPEYDRRWTISNAEILIGFAFLGAGLLTSISSMTALDKLAEKALRPEEINKVTVDLVKEADAAFTQALNMHAAIEDSRRGGGAAR